jgi:hypothetical protein
MVEATEPLQPYFAPPPPTPGLGSRDVELDQVDYWEGALQLLF